MIRHWLGLVLCAGLLQGCGTMKFQPSEYPLRDGLIPPFDVAGTVAIENAQPAKGDVIVYSYGGSKLASNLNAITEVMVQQSRKELEKAGRKKGGTQAKTINLKVNSLLSKYSNLFFWRSNMSFEAKLGDGQTVQLSVPHSSGVLAQDLNGCIAEGVMFLFKDPQVQAYLAK